MTTRRATTATGLTVLLVGNNVPTLTAARALHEAGHRVIAGEGGEFSVLARSRARSESWSHPPIEDVDAFVDALARFLDVRPDVDVVMPMRDPYVLAIAAGRDRLPSDVVIASPDPDVVNLSLDKIAAYEMAREIGVPFQPLAVAPTTADLVTAADEVGYPCVVRPSVASDELPDVLRKVASIRDHAAAQDIAAGTDPVVVPLVLQRYIDGDRTNVHFLASRGNLLASHIAVTERSDQLDGMGLSVASRVVARDPRLVEYCRAIVERLGYSGGGLVQFMVPAGGEPSFLEVNPRLVADFGDAEQAGLPMTIGAITIAIDPDGWQDVPGRHVPVGRRTVWASRDVTSLMFELGRGGIGLRQALRWLGGAVRSAVTADGHLYWDRKDPKPALELLLALGLLRPYRQGRRQR